VTVACAGAPSNRPQMPVSAGAPSSAASTAAPDSFLPSALCPIYERLFSVVHLAVPSDMVAADSERINQSGSQQLGTRVHPAVGLAVSPLFATAAATWSGDYPGNGVYDCKSVPRFPCLQAVAGIVSRLLKPAMNLIQMLGQARRPVESGLPPQSKDG